jgi:hypothetical protein
VTTCIKKNIILFNPYDFTLLTQVLVGTLWTRFCVFATPVLTYVPHIPCINQNHRPPWELIRFPTSGPNSQLSRVCILFQASRRVQFHWIGPEERVILLPSRSCHLHVTYPKHPGVSNSTELDQKSESFCCPHGAVIYT